MPSRPLYLVAWTGEKPIDVGRYCICAHDADVSPLMKWQIRLSSEAQKLKHFIPVLFCFHIQLRSKLIGMLFEATYYNHRSQLLQLGTFLSHK